LGICQFEYEQEDEGGPADRGNGGEERHYEIILIPGKRTLTKRTEGLQIPQSDWKKNKDVIASRSSGLA